MTDAHAAQLSQPPAVMAGLPGDVDRDLVRALRNLNSALSSSGDQSSDAGIGAPPPPRRASGGPTLTAREAGLLARCDATEAEAAALQAQNRRNAARLAELQEQLDDERSTARRVEAAHDEALRKSRDALRRKADECEDLRSQVRRARSEGEKEANRLRDQLQRAKEAQATASAELREAERRLEVEVGRVRDLEEDLATRRSAPDQRAYSYAARGARDESPDEGAGYTEALREKMRQALRASPGDDALISLHTALEALLRRLQSRPQSSSALALAEADSSVKDANMRANAAEARARSAEARARHAERRVRELEAKAADDAVTINELTRSADHAPSYGSELRRAKERVIELETELAAKQWLRRTDDTDATTRRSYAPERPTAGSSLNAREVERCKNAIRSAADRIADVRVRVRGGADDDDLRSAEELCSRALAAIESAGSPGGIVPVPESRAAGRFDRIGDAAREARARGEAAAVEAENTLLQHQVEELSAAARDADGRAAALQTALSTQNDEVERLRKSVKALNETQAVLRADVAAAREAATECEERTIQAERKAADRAGAAGAEAAEAMAKVKTTTDALLQTQQRMLELEAQLQAAQADRASTRRAADEANSLRRERDSLSSFVWELYSSTATLAEGAALGAHDSEGASAVTSEMMARLRSVWSKQRERMHSLQAKAERTLAAEAELDAVSAELTALRSAAERAERDSATLARARQSEAAAASVATTAHAEAEAARDELRSVRERLAAAEAAASAAQSAQERASAHESEARRLSERLRAMEGRLVAATTAEGEARRAATEAGDELRRVKHEMSLVQQSAAATADSQTAQAETLTVALAEAAAETERLRSELKESAAARLTAERRVDELTRSSELLESQVSQLRREAAARADRVSELEAAAEREAGARERVRELEAALEERRAQLEEAMARAHASKQAHDRQSTALAAATAELEALRPEVEEARACARALAAAEADAQAARKDAVAAEEEVARLESLLDEVRASGEAAQQAGQRAAERATAAERAAAEARAQVEDACGERDDAITAAEAGAQAARAAVAEHDAAARDLESTRAAAQSEHERGEGLARDLRAMTARTNDLEAQLGEVRAREAQASRELEEARAEAEEVGTLRRKLADAKDMADKHERMWRECASELETLRADVDTAVRRCAAAESRERDATAELQELRRESEEGAVRESAEKRARRAAEASVAALQHLHEQESRKLHEVVGKLRHKVAHGAALRAGLLETIESLEAQLERTARQREHYRAAATDGWSATGSECGRSPRSGDVVDVAEDPGVLLPPAPHDKAGGTGTSAPPKPAPGRHSERSSAGFGVSLDAAPALGGASRRALGRLSPRDARWDAARPVAAAPSAGHPSQRSTSPRSSTDSSAWLRSAKKQASPRQELERQLAAAQARVKAGQAADEADGKALQEVYRLRVALAEAHYQEASTEDVVEAIFAGTSPSPRTLSVPAGPPEAASASDRA